MWNKKQNFFHLVKKIIRVKHPHMYMYKHPHMNKVEIDRKNPKKYMSHLSSNKKRRVFALH